MPIEQQVEQSIESPYVRQLSDDELEELLLAPTNRVWNGLDQSAGFIIQSSPGGFGLDWIRNLPTQRILDWTDSRHVQCASHI